MYSYSSDNSHQVAKNSSDEKDDECIKYRAGLNCVSAQTPVHSPRGGIHSKSFYSSDLRGSASVTDINSTIPLFELQ